MAAKPNARPAAAGSQRRASGRLAAALLFFSILVPLFDECAVGSGPGCSNQDSQVACQWKKCLMLLIYFLRWGSTEGGASSCGNGCIVLERLERYSLGTLLNSKSHSRNHAPDLARWIPARN